MSKKWTHDTKKKRPSTNASAAPPASQATPATADALAEAAASIKAYKQSEQALTKALKICEAAETSLDVERNRLSQRDADLLVAGEILFDSWDSDPAFATAQQALAQARSIVKSCRQKLKADGNAILAVHESFLASRATAAEKAIADWKEKHWSVVMAAANEGRLLEQVFETDIPELDSLPDTPVPHDKATGSSPWIQTAANLDSISSKVKAIAATEGRYVVRQGFTWSGRDWTANTILDAHWFEPKQIERLIARNMIVPIIAAQGEENITPLKPMTVAEYERIRAGEKGSTPGPHTRANGPAVGSPSNRPAERPFYPAPSRPTDDFVSGLERGAASAHNSTPWLSGGDQ